MAGTPRTAADAQCYPREQVGSPDEAGYETVLAGAFHGDTPAISVNADYLADDIGVRKCGIQSGERISSHKEMIVGKMFDPVGNETTFGAADNNVSGP